MLEQIAGDAQTGYQLQFTGEQEQLQQAHYVVHLPVFEGPLDLLLHLIEKRQMEITTISLMAVTDQYLAYLQQWQEMTGRPPGSPLHISDNGLDASLNVGATLAVARMANMAAFVSIAARLLFIKSQSLLPHISRDEGDDAAESAAVMAEELQRHLVEYKLAREIAQHLHQREETGLQTYGRSGLLAGIEAQLAWTPPTLIGLEAQSLASAFQRLLELRAKDESNGADLLPLARVTIRERISEIANLLSEKPRIWLSEVVENEHSRLVIIVTFLAVLEMWKHERIAVRQEMLMGPIVLERGVRWEEKSI